jgi:tRNA dimethylallyltransferase
LGDREEETLEESKKIPVLVIVGPTASGKTALAIEAAKYYGGEVVSADSMQIYRKMDILSAKPTPEEMEGVPHHMIDVKDPGEAFSVADYVTMAGQAVRDINERKKLPIVCGGTGLYVDSLMKNVSFSEENHDDALRKELYRLAETEGAEKVHAILKDLDPEAAETIHPNNVIRVVRAIEVCKLTGRTFTETKRANLGSESPFAPLYIRLDFEDRQRLYDRINKRVDLMLERGLLDEVKALLEIKNRSTAFNAIGLKEWIPYFEKTASLESCTEKCKQATRNYAKRQLTWFRKNDESKVIFVDNLGHPAEIFKTCKKIVAKCNFL